LRVHEVQVVGLLAVLRQVEPDGAVLASCHQVAADWEQKCWLQGQQQLLLQRYPAVAAHAAAAAAAALFGHLCCLRPEQQLLLGGSQVCVAALPPGVGWLSGCWLVLPLHCCCTRWLGLQLPLAADQHALMLTVLAHAQEEQYVLHTR
jgi:hypothetical protein